jgi:hypothetical protein
MVATDPQGVAWSIELRSSGRVALDARRGRLVLYLLTSLAFTAVCVAVLATSTGVGGRVLSALGVALFGPGVWLFTAQLVGLGSWRSPLVLVDATGITVRHGRLHVPWEAIVLVVPYVQRFNEFLLLVVDEEFHRSWRSGVGWWLRALTVLERRIMRGARTIGLPPNLDADVHVLAAWLTDEAVTRRAGQT